MKGGIHLENRLKIKDLPSFERPYEKLEKYGAVALSDAELLAIIIKTGNKNETSVSLSQRILLEYTEDRGLSALYDLSISELTRIKGVGRVKAIQIKAILEISKRIASLGRYGVKYFIKSPEDVKNLLMEDMRHLAKEVFKVILLNTKNQVLKTLDISIGSLTASIVHPREVFREAVKEGCAGVVFVHNHPSGDPEPSREDIETTKRLIDCGNIIGIRVLDHIIIGDGSFSSLKEKGIM